MFEQLPGNIDLGRQFENPYLQVVLPQFLSLMSRYNSILHFTLTLSRSKPQHGYRSRSILPTSSGYGVPQNDVYWNKSGNQPVLYD